MKIRGFLPVALAAFGIAVVGAGAKADINVVNWPADVPCSALTNNGDGTYTLTQSVMVDNDPSNTIDAGNVFPTADEYHVWSVNCP